MLKTMKQGIQHPTLLLVFVLLLSSSSKLNVLATKQGGLHKEALKQVNDEGFPQELRGGESFDEMMGLEQECGEDDDEECVKGRMMAEAHLDYIYTQHHKP